MEKNSLKCKVHPTEYITNYCARSGCFIQLCAACICDHTQAHNRTNTKPKYELIKDTYFLTNQNLNKLKQSINSQKSRVRSIIDTLNKKNLQVHNFLKQAREQAISTVHKAFDELQQGYNQHLQHEKQKTGLLNQGRLNQIYSELNKQSLDLYNISQQLNTYKYPKLIRQANNEFAPKGRAYLEQISKQLFSNQQFQPSITYRPANLEEVSAAIKKLVTTSVSYPINTINTITTVTTINNQFTRTGRVFSRTPMKDNIIQHINIQPRDLSLRKSNACLKSTIELKSPKADEYGRTMMSNTAKENYWTTKQEPQLKLFSNTYS